MVILNFQLFFYFNILTISYTEFPTWHWVSEHWRQLYVNTKGRGEECILLVVCPIGDEMAECGHIPGEGHALKDADGKEPEKEKGILDLAGKSVICEYLAKRLFSSK